MTRRNGGGDAPTQDRIIAEALIEDIVEWRIPPGSWIREREIAQRFGVSHAPVREAFRQVAHIGFVRIVPWRGAHVIDVEMHAAMQVLELWKSTFGVVCRFAARAISKEETSELLVMLDAYQELVRETRNTLHHMEMGVRIGQFITAHSRAELAADIMRRLTLFARWQHHVVGDDPYLSAYTVHPGIESAALYATLGARISARDPDGAEAAAHALIRFQQLHFAPLLDHYLTEREKSAAAAAPAPKRSRKS